MAAKDVKAAEKADAEAEAAGLRALEDRRSAGRGNVQPGTKFPTPSRKLKKGSPEYERALIWGRQAKDGIVTLCNATDGEHKCYYPLQYVRDPAHNNDLKMTKDEDGRVYIHSRCSYDPLNHGDQRHYPPIPNDRDADLPG